MAARTSRASRSAAQAKQDSTVVPITGSGRAATGDNGGGRKPASTGKPAASRPTSTTKPAAPPKHTVAVKPYPKEFFQPVIDGKPVECEHMGRYGHDSERAALQCARKLAATA